MGEADTTTNYDALGRWAEQCGGRPYRDPGRQSGSGILRLHFGEPDDSLAEIRWEEFLQAFEANELAFLHQDKTASGALSRFNKPIHRQG